MIGIDEVGRGAWAGSLLVVGARLRSSTKIECSDSKTLSKNRRQELVRQFADYYEFGEGWVTPQEIDNLGLTNAMRLGVNRVLVALSASIDQHIIIDGNINYCSTKYIKSSCLIKADGKINEVSVASVYAKVKRDNLMAKLDLKYPGYDFANNMGYGTKKHQQALFSNGVTDIHRRSFAPIKKRLK